MERVVIAPRVATVSLGLLTCFALGGLLIAGLMVVGADAIARNSGGQARDIYIGAAVIGAIAILVLGLTLRQWPGIAAIEVDRGGWRLIDRFGRATTVAAGTPVELSLRCRRLIYVLNGIPRRQDVVDGELRAGAVRRTLAWSGPFTYGRVLGALGVSGGPPARGTTHRYTTRA